MLILLGHLFAFDFDIVKTHYEENGPESVEHNCLQFSSPACKWSFLTLFKIHAGHSKDRKQIDG